MTHLLSAIKFNKTVAFFAIPTLSFKNMFFKDNMLTNGTTAKYNMWNRMAISSYS